MVDLIIVNYVQGACVQIIELLQSISHKLKPLLTEITSFNVVLEFSHDFLGLLRLVYAFLLEVEQAFSYLLFLFVGDLKIGFRLEVLPLNHF